MFSLSQLDKYLPAWMSEDSVRKLMEVWTLAYDAIIEGVFQCRDHLYSYAASPDALPYLGRDRSLVPGLLETPTTFSGRLSKWRHIWRGAGTVKTILTQVAAVWGPNAPKMRIVREFGWNSGNMIKKARWTTRNPDGTFEEHIEEPSNFNWDNQDLKSRFFLIIYLPTEPPMEKEGIYGDFLSQYGQKGVKPTDGKKGSYTIGTTAFSEYVQRTRYALDLFKPAHTLVPFIIIATDPTSFDPTSPANSPGMPDGTWARKGILSAGVYTKSRNPTARYWKGPQN